MDWTIITSPEAAWNAILQMEFYKNGLATWTVALGITLLAYLALSIVRKVSAERIFAIARLTKAEPLNFVARLVQSTHPMVLLTLSIFIGSQALELPGGLGNLVRALPVLSVLAQVAVWGNSMIDFMLNRYVECKENEQDRIIMKTMLGPVKFIALLAFWSILLLMGLSNLGVNITALVAGMGVGGIALALAVQNILGDLFASMSIVIDKPFVIGDFIIVGEFPGTVEYIGLKTTRVRGLGGEQLIFSNSDLLSSRIRNFKRMQERRAIFQFGVIYQTPVEQVEKIPGLVAEIIDGIELARLDRSHFKGFGDSSLDFEVVYHVLDPAYGIYMDIQQEINLTLMRHFKKMGVEFAYPTRTLYVANESPAFKVLHAADPYEDALESASN